MDKLAKQDFSAAVTKQELVEIQSQVQIAKEEMDKRAVTMAVKAEEVGLELAKELTHNLGAGCRTFPIASSGSWRSRPGPSTFPGPNCRRNSRTSWATWWSRKKTSTTQSRTRPVPGRFRGQGRGLGRDGRSDQQFSAKGITGNLLPNNTEINGRSGEGRSGRASGEFVAQTAKGKGGRRTPTRLTRDAFQAGKIDDQSKEPAGGATGGGKLAGAGAEGLTGPRPKQMLPNLPALKEKQALLLSKTKLAQLQARRNNWGNFDLDKVVRLMAANRSDLDRGAYRSVLARRNILIGALEEQQDAHRRQVSVGPAGTQAAPEAPSPDADNRSAGDSGRIFGRSSIDTMNSLPGRRKGIEDPTHRSTAG